MRLESLSLDHANRIADILSTDAKLNSALHTALVQVDPHDYFQTAKEWESLRHGRVFAVVDNNQVIGTATFVPRDGASLTAGGWIRSDLWGKGLGARAFRLLVRAARDQGFRHMTANLSRDAQAALPIWQAYPIILRSGQRFLHPWLEL